MTKPEYVLDAVRRLDAAGITNESWYDPTADMWRVSLGTVFAHYVGPNGVGYGECDGSALANRAWVALTQPQEATNAG